MQANSLINLLLIPKPTQNQVDLALQAPHQAGLFCDGQASRLNPDVSSPT